MAANLATFETTLREQDAIQGSERLIFIWHCRQGMYKQWHYNKAIQEMLEKTLANLAELVELEQLFEDQRNAGLKKSLEIWEDGKSQRHNQSVAGSRGSRSVNSVQDAAPGPIIAHPAKPAPAPVSVPGPANPAGHTPRNTLSNRHDAHRPQPDFILQPASIGRRENRSPSVSCPETGDPMEIDDTPLFPLAGVPQDQGSSRRGGSHSKSRDKQKQRGRPRGK